MQGSIAQSAALVVYANERVRGHDPEFWPQAGVFRFCERVTFVKNADAYAAEPREWTTRIAHEGTRGVRLHHVSTSEPALADRLSVAFVGGGGAWLIETIGGGGSSAFWQDHWEVNDRSRPDKKIWRVTYRCVAEGASTAAPLMDLETEKQRLRDALAEASAFAAAHELAFFDAAFQQGLRALTQPDASSSLSPPGAAHVTCMSIAAKQVLAAAEAGWVFGGMGSWNDLGFRGEEQATYVRVSERLFSAMCECVCAGVNSTCPSLP